MNRPFKVGDRVRYKWHTEHLLSSWGVGTIVAVTDRDWALYRVKFQDGSTYDLIEEEMKPVVEIEGFEL